MNINASKPQLQELADFQAMIAHAFRRKPVDPDVAQRVHERDEKIRDARELA